MAVLGKLFWCVLEREVTELAVARTNGVLEESIGADQKQRGVVLVDKAHESVFVLAGGLVVSFS